MAIAIRDNEPMNIINDIAYVELSITHRLMDDAGLSAKVIAHEVETALDSLFQESPHKRAKGLLLKIDFIPNATNGA
jgi:hypothetical protein